MKKIFLICSLFFISFAIAQKINYVDSQLILEQMPSYKQAQINLQNQVNEWEKELVAKKDSIASFETQLEEEKILLTENQIKEKKLELEKKKQEVQEIKQKYFGPTGQLIRMRQSLARPFQDQIWNAINKIAKKRAIGVVLDKSSDLVMIYSDPRLDITDLVIKELNPKEKSESNNKKTKK